MIRILPQVLIINVGKAGENKNFNGLDINTVNTDPAKPIKEIGRAHV